MWLDLRSSDACLDLGLEARVDPGALEVLLECNRKRTLEDLVAETAGRRHDTTTAVANLIEEPVRQLVERGFMIPINGVEPC